MNEPPNQTVNRAGWLGSLVDARRGELPLLLMAAAFHFLLFFAYYMLRPLRSEIQSEHAQQQDALYTATFVSVLIFVPLYAVLIANRPRRVFLPIVYAFFAVNLAAFWWVFRFGSDHFLKWTEWTYFVWVSVFNLFAVSVFWGFMADVFRPEQAKRLFGAIAAGASVGGLAGSAFTASNVDAFGRANLVLLAGIVLGASAAFVWPLDRLARRTAGSWAGATIPATNIVSDTSGEPKRSALAGLLAIVRSPYLLGICGFIFLFTLSSTFLDQTRAYFVQAAISDRDARTEFFAWQETAVNAATLVVQLFIVGRIMRWFGVATALAGLPVLSILGFTALGFTLLPLSDGIAAAGAEQAGVTLIDDPLVRRAMIAIVFFEVIQRMARYALAKPSREVLFTVVSRNVKYQAKPFIDTVVYRGGDVASAWTYSLLYKAIGLSLASIAFAALPAAGVGIVLAVWLGRKQTALARGAVSSPAGRTEAAANEPHH